MVMDILRSHHLTKTRMVRDSGVTTWLRWYPSAPGALAFPEFHAFGDPVWDSDFPEPDGVGCLPEPLIWRPKRYPAPPGQHWHGPLDWFAHGLPSVPAESPPGTDICGVPAIMSRGGVQLAGEGWRPAHLVAGSVCGCALPSAAILVSPTVNVAGRACGCGVPMSACLTYNCVAGVCGCGLPASTHSASGDGTGTGGGPITVVCCPDNPVSATLNAAVTNGGICDGDYHMTYEPAPNNWAAHQSLGNCIEPGTVAFALVCFVPTESWKLTPTTASPDIYDPVFVQCSPFELHFIHVDLTNCGGSADATVIITE